MAKKEKMRRYFDAELNSTLFHAVLGIIVGYVSFLVNVPVYNLAMAIVVLILVNFLIKAIFKVKEKFSWWLSNGIVIYLLFWLIVWSIFYNLRLFS